jgi:hypothetical protein
MLICVFFCYFGYLFLIFVIVKKIKSITIDNKINKKDNFYL